MVHEQHWRSLLHTTNPSFLELQKYSPVSFLAGLFLSISSSKGMIMKSDYIAKMESGVWEKGGNLV